MVLACRGGGTDRECLPTQPNPAVRVFGPTRWLQNQLYITEARAVLPEEKRVARVSADGLPFSVR